MAVVSLEQRSIRSLGTPTSRRGTVLVGKRLPYLTEGAWAPGSINWLIPTIQGLLSIQAAARGMDYLHTAGNGQPMPPALTAIEEALPLTVWGGLLLLFAGLVFVGLFGGWVWPIIVGHTAIAGLNGAFGYGVLSESPVRSSNLALVGVSLIVPGLLLGVSRWKSKRWVRFSLAITMLFAGGWIAGYALGSDYRNGTSLFVGAACHAALAVGIAHIAYRRPPDIIS